MKKLITLTLLTVSLLFLSFNPTALAADIAHGGQIFSAQCAACHAGGRNVISANNTLKKDALEKYGMYDLAAIKNQVTNGKAAMPAFGNRISSEDIEDVASYVLAQAEKGW
ncbi:MAG: cytochrome c6 PetJ [Microcystaceae cyanobacterium]